LGCGALAGVALCRGRGVMVGCGAAAATGDNGNPGGVAVAALVSAGPVVAGVTAVDVAVISDEPWAVGPQEARIKAGIPCKKSKTTRRRVITGMTFYR